MGEEEIYLLGCTYAQSPERCEVGSLFSDEVGINFNSSPNWAVVNERNFVSLSERKEPNGIITGNGLAKVVLRAVKKDEAIVMISECGQEHCYAVPIEDIVVEKEGDYISLNDNARV